MKQTKTQRPFNTIISDIKWNTGNLPKRVVFYDNYDDCNYPMYMGKTYNITQSSNIEYHLKKYVKDLFNTDAQVIAYNETKIYVS
jgi:hypothetical protein